MKNHLRKLIAIVLAAVLLMSTFPAITAASAESNTSTPDASANNAYATQAADSDIVIGGSFGKKNYTMEANGTINIAVNASVKNANLTRVTINVNVPGEERRSSVEIKGGTTWSGSLSLDGTVAPLNVPGTYTIKLFVGVDAGNPNWAEVDQATLVVTEVQYDDLVVDIEDPGEVLPGENFTVRSSVSGGSGDYEYLWNWTHPDGTELTLSKKNCSIYTSVAGTYTFMLTVTDNVTGETCTSKKLTVKVEPSQETYDPMKVRFIGGDEEIEIELAMVGIAAKCKVTGGSGNFQYGWNIERDGEIIQRYSYGVVDDVCTWKADKVGKYTFYVTVKDLETDLTESASHSITVVQKEYDPLTLEIISAPKYAELGETVRVVAETTGGVGSVATTWEVYLGNTLVTSGKGLTAQFAPTSDGEYEVIFYAQDEAQTLEDRVSIIAGNHVKCALSVSSTSLYVGDVAEAKVTVQDGIGPFSYSWMLNLDGNFVSSELDSENTSYSWTATQAGTYRIECTVYDLGNEELIGKMVYATDSVDVTVANPDTGKLPDPVVNVTVNGTTAVVTWDAIDGAVRYVYSLRNLTNTTEPAIEHAPVDGLSITLNNLEPESEYRVAIGAVPSGVTDTTVDKDKCGWGTKTFTIPKFEKLPDPVVKVTVNGTTAVVTWDAIDGAVRYVYSLYNVTTNNRIANHAAVNGLSVTLNNLDPDTQYRVSIGAVPDGVTDTVTEHKKCSWGTETFEIVRLPKPDVTVVVDGATMIASWEDVPGAVRYVFSLRKTSEPNGDPPYNHVETNGCSITLDLEPGVEYRLAVAAVPAGVEDTKAETNKCTWALVTFTTETLEEINTPKVLKVETDMKANFLLPGEEVTIKVTCNKATKYLDVYDPAYRTLKDPEFNKEGYPYFEYIVSYAATGKMELRFIALDEQLEWSRKKEHQGFLDIIVCDHTTTPKLISTSNATKKDRNVHTVTETYEDACLCGKVSNTWSKEVDKPHTWGALQASKTHTQGKGHRRFYECTACHQVKDADYVSFLVGKDNAKKCSTCWARYELIKELQELLSERGYSVGDAGFDGIFGNDTKNAMNAFRKDVMKLGPIDDVDEATMAALRNGISPITSTSIRWSMSRLDRTVNIKVEATSGRLVKGEYYLLVSNDGGNTYTQNKLFLVSGGETSVEHTFDIYRDLKLTDGRLYHVATAPLGWKSGDSTFLVGTIDLRDKTGFITSPRDGDPIAFFNKGAITVYWEKQSGNNRIYRVELYENGKRIYVNSTLETQMTIKVSEIESYTTEDWNINHTIQINVTAVD